MNWTSQGPFRVTDTGLSTENVPSASTVIGAVSALVLDGDTALIGTTNGGVWKTDNIHAADGNVHWYSATDMSNITCTSIGALVQDPFDRNHYLAGCAPSSSWMSQFSELNGLMHSHDGGKTWNMISAFPLNLGLYSIVIPAPGHILVGVRLEFDLIIRTQSSQRGIWHSADSGKTWAKVSLPNLSVNDTTTASAIYRMVSDPADPTFVVAGSRMGLYISANAGASFHNVSHSLDLNNASAIVTSDNIVLSIASKLVGTVRQRVIWAGFTSCPDYGSNGCVFAIYRSIDNGTSWSLMSQPGTMERSGFSGLGAQGTNV